MAAEEEEKEKDGEAPAWAKKILNLLEKKNPEQEEGEPHLVPTPPAPETMEEEEQEEEEEKEQEPGIMKKVWSFLM